MNMLIARRKLLAAAAALVAQPAWPAIEHARQVLVMRHALTTPGVGDPPNFALGRCETQRNLSDEGRAQAREFGRRLAAVGWRPVHVRSSRWCRCLDTGRELLAGLNAPSLGVQPWTALDSVFGAPERVPAQNALLKERLKVLQAADEGPQLWITHQVNIGALTGSAAAMGEALWLALLPDGRVAARPFS